MMAAGATGSLVGVAGAKAAASIILTAAGATVSLVGVAGAKAVVSIILMAAGATGSPVGVAGANAAVAVGEAADVIGVETTVATVFTVAEAAVLAATETADTPERAVSAEATDLATVLATVLATALMATVLEAAGPFAEVVIVVVVAGATTDPRKRTECRSTTVTYFSGIVSSNHSPGDVGVGSLSGT